MRRILIAGATGGIAIEFARRAVQAGDKLYLVARNATRLDALAQDLRVRGGAVEIHAADLDELGSLDTLVTKAKDALGGLDTVLIAHGSLPVQAEAEARVDLLQKTVHTNFTSAAALAESAARLFKTQGSGTICVITSVAGDRGRPTNYVYGSTKAALQSYLSGLRARMFKVGVAVVDVRPGFVDTPMTAHLAKNALFASSRTVADGIYKAIEASKAVVYLPGFWRLIMWIIRSIPEFVFKRLSL